MPEYLAPGVYVEEVSTGPKPIEGVSTSTAGFAGRTERGPTQPRLVTSFIEYQRWFGSYVEPSKSYLPYAIQGFFENGGKRAFIARVVAAGARAASRNLPTSESTLLVASALGPGKWGNNLLVRVTPGSRADLSVTPPRDLFRVTVLYFKDGIPTPFVDPTTRANLASPFFVEPTVIEDFDNLSVTPGSPTYVVNTVNAGSRLIHLEWADPDPEVEPVPDRPDDSDFGRTAAAELATAKDSTKLELFARGAGEWANAVSFEIVASEDNADGVDLTVQWNTFKEEFQELLADPESPNYVLDVINANSRLIRASWKSSATESARQKLADAAGKSTAAQQKVEDAQTALDEATTEEDSKKADTQLKTARKNAAKAGEGEAAARTALAKAEAEEDDDEATAALPAAAKGELEDGEDIPFESGSEADITPGDFAGKGTAPVDKRTALAGLETIDEISLLVVPDEVNPAIRNNFQITNATLDQCERLKDRFAVLSVLKGSGSVQNIYPPRDTSYGAIYYPWIRIFDPQIQDTLLIPPSGHVAGIYARSDVERGVHKAPANEVVRGIITRDLNSNRGPLEFKINKGEHDILNPRGIDVIRDFRSDRRGIRVWGARTMSSDPEWKYVSVRRLFLFIEESIDEGTQWVVFEPNDEQTWGRVVRSVSNFLVRVWRDGALMGSTQDEAFFVKCDRSTMTQDDIDNGRLICYIGVAPVKPAEFVIFRISQKTIEATQ